MFVYKSASLPCLNVFASTNTELSLHGSIQREAFKMNIQDICNQQWYLALYITGGRNRENLFDWLSDQNIIPWTPLTLTKIRRADAPHVFRKRVSAVFPGYFFLKANFEYHKIDTVRAHSAFCDFVKFGSKITPVKNSVVDGLMKVFPDPAYKAALLSVLTQNAGDMQFNGQKIDAAAFAEASLQSLVSEARVDAAYASRETAPEADRKSVV